MKRILFLEIHTAIINPGMDKDGGSIPLLLKIMTLTAIQSHLKAKMCRVKRPLQQITKKTIEKTFCGSRIF